MMALFQSFVINHHIQEWQTGLFQIIVLSQAYNIYNIHNMNHFYLV